MATDLVPKSSKIFHCEICDYLTSRKSQFDRHVSTDKHKQQQKSTKINKKVPESSTAFMKCACGKEYKDRSGLWRHKRSCNKEIDLTPDLILNIIQQNQEFKDLLIEQNKQNVELQKQVLEVSKSGHVTTNMNNSMNNSNNKTFNLQVFLNETCKDAMNIMDFVDSIKLQLSDLESVGQLGYINGLSKIIIKNLRALDENMRPVHCSDLKREKIYVKDADKWEKEGADNKILKNAIKYIAHKNVKMIPVFREKYPDCIYSDSRKSDQYNRLIIEAMGGEGNDEDGKSNKIISKIAKEILIEK
jgi:hypothetical protein